MRLQDKVFELLQQAQREDKYISPFFANTILRALEDDDYREHVSQDEWYDVEDYIHSCWSR